MNELIEKRRSIRKYQSDKPVTSEQLKAIIGAGMLSPSAHNTRPWEFIAVTKREILDEIAEIHPYGKMLRTATAAIIIVALPQTGKAEGFFPQDCAAAAQNILLETVSQELGACWCAVYPNDELIAHFRRIFSLSEPKTPFCIIALGTPDESPRPRGFVDESRISYIF